MEEAIEGALCERIERIARQRWWNGEETARPIAEEWLRETGVRAFEASLRGTMAGHWRASFFLIGEGMPLETVVVITDGPEGRSLGTAATSDPALAARSALNEAILEEVPLLTGAGKEEDRLKEEERAAMIRSSKLRLRLEAQEAEPPMVPSETREGFPESMTSAFAADLTLDKSPAHVARGFICMRFTHQGKLDFGITAADSLPRHR